MFFLTPNKFSISIILNSISNVFIREGSNLFNSNDGNIISLKFFSVSVEIPVNLTRANNNLLSSGGSDILINFVNNILEKIGVIGEFSEFLDVGARKFISKELLGSESN